MSGSRTTTKDDGLLDNVHPGKVLYEDFLIGSEIPLNEVAAGTGIDPDKLAKLVAGKTAIDADADLRLGRYFGMSEGFFLRLQNGYDLEEVRRSHGLELAGITRRAA